MAVNYLCVNSSSQSNFNHGHNLNRSIIAPSINNKQLNNRGSAKTKTKSKQTEICDTTTRKTSNSDLDLSIDLSIRIPANKENSLDSAFVFHCGGCSSQFTDAEEFGHHLDSCILQPADSTTDVNALLGLPIHHENRPRDLGLDLNPDPGPGSGSGSGSFYQYHSSMPTTDVERERGQAQYRGQNGGGQEEGHEQNPDDLFTQSMDCTDDGGGENGEEILTGNLPELDDVEMILSDLPEWDERSTVQNFVHFDYDLQLLDFHVQDSIFPLTQLELGVQQEKEVESQVQQQQQLEAQNQDASPEVEAQNEVEAEVQSEVNQKMEIQRKIQSIKKNILISIVGDDSDDEFEESARSPIYICEILSDENSSDEEGDHGRGQIRGHETLTKSSFTPPVTKLQQQLPQSEVAVTVAEEVEEQEQEQEQEQEEERAKSPDYTMEEENEEIRRLIDTIDDDDNDNDKVNYDQVTSNNDQCPVNLQDNDYGLEIEEVEMEVEVEVGAELELNLDLAADQVMSRSIEGQGQLEKGEINYVHDQVFDAESDGILVEVGSMFQPPDEELLEKEKDKENAANFVEQTEKEAEKEKTSEGSEGEVSLREIELEMEMIHNGLDKEKEVEELDLEMDQEQLQVCESNEDILDQIVVEVGIGAGTEIETETEANNAFPSEPSPGQIETAENSPSRVDPIDLTPDPENEPGIEELEHECLIMPDDIIEEEEDKAEQEEEEQTVGISQGQDEGQGEGQGQSQQFSPTIDFINDHEEDPLAKTPQSPESDLDSRHEMDLSHDESESEVEMEMNIQRSQDSSDTDNNAQPQKDSLALDDNYTTINSPVNNYSTNYFAGIPETEIEGRTKRKRTFWEELEDRDWLIPDPVPLPAFVGEICPVPVPVPVNEKDHNTALDSFIPDENLAEKAEDDKISQNLEKDALESESQGESQKETETETQNENKIEEQTQSPTENERLELSPAVSPAPSSPDSCSLQICIDEEDQIVQDDSTKTPGETDDKKREKEAEVVSSTQNSNNNIDDNISNNDTNTESKNDKKTHENDKDNMDKAEPPCIQLPEKTPQRVEKPVRNVAPELDLQALESALTRRHSRRIVQILNPNARLMFLEQDQQLLNNQQRQKPKRVRKPRQEKQQQQPVEKLADKEKEKEKQALEPTGKESGKFKLSSPHLISAILQPSTTTTTATTRPADTFAISQPARQKEIQRESQKEIPREIQRGSQKETAGEIQRERQKEIPGEIQKESQKEISGEIQKERQKEIPGEIQRGSQKESSRESQKEIPGEIQREIQKKIPGEIQRESQKDIPRETQKRPTELPSQKHIPLRKRSLIQIKSPSQIFSQDSELPAFRPRSSTLTPIPTSISTSTTSYPTPRVSTPVLQSSQNSQAQGQVSGQPRSSPGQSPVQIQIPSPSNYQVSHPLLFQNLSSRSSSPGRQSVHSNSNSELPSRLAGGQGQSQSDDIAEIIWQSTQQTRSSSPSPSPNLGHQREKGSTESQSKRQTEEYVYARYAEQLYRYDRRKMPNLLEDLVAEEIQQQREHRQYLEEEQFKRDIYSLANNGNPPVSPVSSFRNRKKEIKGKSLKPQSGHPGRSRNSPEVLIVLDEEDSSSNDARVSSSCSICHSTFSSLDRLIDHLQVHDIFPPLDGQSRHIFSPLGHTQDLGQSQGQGQSQARENRDGHSILKEVLIAGGEVVNEANARPRSGSGSGSQTPRPGPIPGPGMEPGPKVPARNLEPIPVVIPASLLYSYLAPEIASLVLPLANPALDPGQSAPPQGHGQSQGQSAAPPQIHGQGQSRHSTSQSRSHSKTPPKSTAVTSGPSQHAGFVSSSTPLRPILPKTVKRPGDSGEGRANSDSPAPGGKKKKSTSGGSGLLRAPHPVPFFLPTSISPMIDSDGIFRPQLDLPIVSAEARDRGSVITRIEIDLQTAGEPEGSTIPSGSRPDSGHSGHGSRSQQQQQPLIQSQPSKNNDANKGSRGDASVGVNGGGWATPTPTPVGVPHHQPPPLLELNSLVQSINHRVLQQDKHPPTAMRSSGASPAAGSPNQNLGQPQGQNQGQSQGQSQVSGDRPFQFPRLPKSSSTSMPNLNLNPAQKNASVYDFDGDGNNEDDLTKGQGQGQSAQPEMSAMPRKLPAKYSRSTSSSQLLPAQLTSRSNSNDNGNNNNNSVPSGSISPSGQTPVNPNPMERSSTPARSSNRNYNDNSVEEDGPLDLSAKEGKKVVRRPEPIAADLSDTLDADEPEVVNLNSETDTYNEEEDEDEIELHGRRAALLYFGSSSHMATPVQKLGQSQSQIHSRNQSQRSTPIPNPNEGNSHRSTPNQRPNDARSHASTPHDVQRSRQSTPIQRMNPDVHRSTPNVHRSTPIQRPSESQRSTPGQGHRSSQPSPSYSMMHASNWNRVTAESNINPFYQNQSQSQPHHGHGHGLGLTLPMPTGQSSNSNFNINVSMAKDTTRASGPSSSKPFVSMFDGILSGQSQGQGQDVGQIQGQDRQPVIMSLSLDEDGNLVMCPMDPSAPDRVYPNLSVIPIPNPNLMPFPMPKGQMSNLGHGITGGDSLRLSSPISSQHSHGHQSQNQNQNHHQIQHPTHSQGQGQGQGHPRREGWPGESSEVTELMANPWESWTCASCSKSFSTKRGLDAHKRGH